MLPRGPSEHVKTGVQFAQDRILRLLYRLECDSPQIFNVDKDARDERFRRGDQLPVVVTGRLRPMSGWVCEPFVQRSSGRFRIAAFPVGFSQRIYLFFDLVVPRSRSPIIK
jgi:hypothetical protein